MPASTGQQREAEPAIEEPDYPHTEVFCENLHELCERITAEEHRLLAAAETDDESRMAESRAELNKLYKQYIYV